MATIAVERLVLRLFGSPLLMRGGVVMPLGRRARALLGYLALGNPPRATRERITGLFWPDRAEAQARASLRQCLVELRGTIDTAIQADREWVALNTAGLAGDWFDLDAAMAMQDAAGLARALVEIGGRPLLDGIEFGESFDDWLRSTRAAFEGRLAANVMQRVASAGQAGDTTAALALADAWTARDPLDEAVTTAAIRIEMAQNAVVAARKRFRNFEQALERDGSGQPGHLMRAALDVSAVDAAPPTPSPPATAPAAPPLPAAITGAAPSRKPGIAVMLFRHPGGDADQAYFAEGMADDIIAGLARSRMIRVTSRQSSLSIAAQDADTQQVCADLGVRYLVRGQVRRLGPAMRVSVELADGAHDETIWAGRYDRPIADLFSVQDEITTAIVATIEPALLGREQKLAVESNRGLDHWDLLMRGRYHFWRATRDDLATANDLLLKALEVAPDDAATLALLAMTELGEVWAGTRGDVLGILRRAHDYAMRAVAADPRDSAAHHALGIVLSFMGQSDQAAAEQRLALELNPTSAPARGELGRLLAFRAETEEALVSAEEAIRLSPTDPHVWLWYRSKAIACFCAGRFEESVAHALDACARRPDYFFLHFLVAACHGANGNLDAARSACAQGLLIHPKYSMRALILGHPFARSTDLNNYVGALRTAGWLG